MPHSSIHAIAAQFCIAGAAPPQITVAPAGDHVFSTTVDTVDFVFRHNPAAGSGLLVIDVLFGVLPPASDARVQRELLLANRQLRRRPGGPSFSCDPQSGKVVLRYIRPIAQTSGESLRTGLHAVALTVLHWRRTFVLARRDGECSIDVPDVAGLPS
jgi:hypothetical protein